MSKNKRNGLSENKRKDINPLKNPSLYIDRELSWLEFNNRVLEESKNTSVPLLERLKFASIFSSNLDEFFMVRIGGLYKALKADIKLTDPSGKTLNQKLDLVTNKVKELLEKHQDNIRNEILPKLEKWGIHILSIKKLSKAEKENLSQYFEEQVFPILTPLAVDAGHPSPFLGNLKFNIMVIFESQMNINARKPYAFVEVPSVVPRFIPVKARKKNGFSFILLEDLIYEHIHRLFPGMNIIDLVSLRVTRNQDYDLDEEQVLDLAGSVQSQLHNLAKQIVVRIEISKEVPSKIIQLLSKDLELDEKFIYKINGPINICDFLTLYKLPLDPSLKEPPFNPRIPRVFSEGKDIFSIIREQGTVLLHHPYDSFAVVMDFINTAADDPNVLAIKQTLYRIGYDSPIIPALRRAAENGKQVTAVIELKARFDEKHNIDWALQMQEAGVNAVFGFVRFKTHCKATLIVRREGKKLKRYVHVSTGNYNSFTAKYYTDVGLLTCDPEFGNDVSSLFNVLTGFNSWTQGEMFPKKKVSSMFHSFMISPVTTEKTIAGLIDRETKNSTPKNPGRIIAKMNALVDDDMIQRLYAASQAGVRIDLIVRGICCLKPGIPGISDNITVTSIIDRFLEHSRIYYFHNKGSPEIYSGSADWMTRSFDKRVEILYPIIGDEIKSRIINEILLTYLSDNVKAWRMQTDGSYRRLKPKPGVKSIRSQSELIATARRGGVKSPPYDEVVKKVGSKNRFKKT